MISFTDNPSVNKMLLLCWNLYLVLLAILTIESWQVVDKFWIIWLLHCGPLLMLLPGLLQKHYRTYSWLCFLLLVYFTSYVVQVYATTGGVIDVIALIVVIAMFVLSMLISRRLQRMVKNVA